MSKNEPVGAPTIAIVDDDESMREAVKTLIGSIGFSVEEFSSAEGFLKSGRWSSFGCLILDVRMPGLSGFELHRQLIADKKAVPIVFITAHYSEEDRIRALKRGAVAFLSKPFTEEELLDAIDASLAMNRKPDVTAEEERIS